MKNPIVSIIAPSYNQAEFIGKTICSVVNQKYPDIQYLVIDGGSSGGSVEIIKKYNKRIDYFVSEKDAGQSASIKKGVKNSIGDIVCWLSSDDLIAEGAVSSVVEFFSENPGAKFLYGDGDIFFHGKNKKTIRNRPGCFDKHELFRKDPIQQPSAFWKRDLHEEIGYIDESLH
jgi:glycosyltransferase involved in cell wall biosynthesis